MFTRSVLRFPFGLPGSLAIILLLAIVTGTAQSCSQVPGDGTGVGRSASAKTGRR
ncbi:MAG: hypothetical protein ROO76_06385 [Terriglobia bacterium]|nr:hypothetical protein [Terriglobia bacterium]